MTQANFLRAQLTPTHIKSLVSAPVYTRGTGYAAAGAVLLQAAPTDAALDAKALEICATVQGTANYDVRLFFSQATLQGHCNCQGGQTGWFCKHQVATALVWHAAQSGLVVQLDAQAQKTIQSSAKRAKTVLENQAALEAFIAEVPKSELASKVIQLLRQDKMLAKELQAWRKVYQIAQTSNDAKPVIAALLKSSKKTLHGHESAPYVKQAMPVLELLANQTQQDPKAGFLLSLYAFERANMVYCNSDDSGGHIGGLCSRIAAVVMNAANAGGPLHAETIEPLFKAMISDQHDFFILQDILPCLDPIAREKFKALTQARYNKMIDYDKQHMGDWLVKIFTHEQDFEAAIAVFKADLSDSYRRLKLVQYLNQIGRHREAFNQAEQALRIEPDDQRIQKLMLELYRRDGWHEEAYQLSKSRLYKRFDPELLGDFLSDANAAGHDVAIEKKQLHQALIDLENTWHKKYQSDTSVHDVGRRLDMLIADSDWPAISQLINTDVTYPVHTGIELITKIPEQYRELGNKVCQFIVAKQLLTDTNPYAHTLRLVRLSLRTLTADEGNHWLSQLVQQYKIKVRLVVELRQLMV